MSHAVERIQATYQVYLERMEELEQNRKPGDGLFGLPGGPASDPCQDVFVRELTQALAALAETSASEELRQGLEYVYEAPLARREDKTVYWMLAAAHSLTVPHLDKLTPEDAEALYQTYREAYPRRERLPAQKHVLARLKERARS